MKTLIAVPCQEKIDTAFINSIINQIGDCEIVFAANSLVYMARDELARKAVNEGFDNLLFIDSDMILAPDSVERIRTHLKAYPIVTGLCFRRCPPYLPAIWKRLTLEGQSAQTEIYLDYPSGLFEVEACGMAFCGIDTKVLKAVFEAKNSCFYPMLGFGEDISFCLRARQQGFPIFCDSMIKIGHLTQMAINEDSYLTTKGGKANGNS